MTEETDNQQETNANPEPDQFEVKWTKKSSSSSTPAQAQEIPDVAALRRQLEEEQQRTKDLQDKWHRAEANLANFRKRTEQERGEVEKFATLVLVQELLPVLDNFDRAVDTIPGNLQMLTWIQGVLLMQRHLQAILERQGLTQVETEGQFNPHLHEAIAERESTDAAPGAILQVYQKGYSMHGLVIRPALVEIAKAPEAQQTPPPEPDEPQPEITDEDDAEEIAEDAESENTGP